jgi:molecular chaperone DnaJ
LNIKIPAGIDTDSRLKITGEGEAGERGGMRGDLYVHILVKSHSLLARQGNDLYCEMFIPFSIAALGGEVIVPTLDGQVRLRIPAGTPSGKVFRLRERGMPYLGRNSRGDELVRVEVEVPTRLSDKEKTLLQEWARERKEDTGTPKKKGLFDHLKDSF